MRGDRIIQWVRYSVWIPSSATCNLWNGDKVPKYQLVSRIKWDISIWKVFSEYWLLLLLPLPLLRKQIYTSFRGRYESTLLLQLLLGKFFFHSKATFAFIFFLFHRWTEEKNRKSYIQTLKRCDVIVRKLISNVYYGHFASITVTGPQYLHHKPWGVFVSLTSKIGD